MYKTLEITEIIGAYYVEGWSEISITIAEVKNIMTKVKESDRFISTPLSRKTIFRMFELADMEKDLTKNKISIPYRRQTKSRFVREYYKMDIATRTILSQIIKELTHG